jgi:hypothetical protein
MMSSMTQRSRVNRRRLATWWDHWTHPMVVTDRRMAMELQAIGDHQAALLAERARRP